MATFIRLFSLAILLVGLLASYLVLRTMNFVPPKGAPVELALAVQIDANRAAQHLSEAIRFQTVSHQNPADDDQSAWLGLRAWLINTYPKFHAIAKREELPNGALLYTWSGTDPGLPPIILMAHQDVVPVAKDAESLWKAPPFSGAIMDGAVWGRGSIDDKGSLIALMEAVETLAEKGTTPKRTVMIVSGQDEEVGGTGATAVAALLEQRGIKAEFVLDEGLVVLGQHPLSGTPAALVAVTEKGYATLRLTARAAGGHSSSPPPNTAVGSLAKGIVNITAHPFPMTLKGPMLEGLLQIAPQADFVTRMAVVNAWLFEPLIIKAASKAPSAAAGLHTTIAPTMLEGSPKDNVLPSAAIARINYRLSPEDSVDSVFERAREAVKGLDIDLQWEPGASGASAVSSTGSLGYRTIAALNQEIFSAPSAPSVMIGGTDGRKLEPVAKDVYRFLPVELSLTDTAMYHGQNEHISIDSLAKASGFYARLIATTAM